MSMRDFIKVTILFALVTVNLSLHAAQTIKHYEINIRLDTEAQALKVKTKIELNKERDNIELLLHPKVNQLKITNRGKAVEYSFDKDAIEKPSIYFDGQLLKIAENEIEDRLIQFEYEVSTKDINYWQADNVAASPVLHSGLEVGMYSSWIPFQLVNGDFSYQVTAELPADYSMVGNGALQTDEGKWVLTSISNQFDIPIAISSLHTSTTFKFGSLNVEVNHFGLPDKELAQIKTDINLIMTLFNEKFGQLQGTGNKVQFVYTPRVSGSFYSRKGYAVIGGRSQLSKFNTLAHEIGHFWWTGADSNSWQDWLNESFAEYSALLAFREKYGEAKYYERVKSYGKHADNKHAIWGSDRSEGLATLLLYRKGPIILDQLKHRIGEQKFYRVLMSFLNNNVRNTDHLLSIIAKETSSKDSNWLKTYLQDGVNISPL